MTTNDNSVPNEQQEGAAAAAAAPNVIVLARNDGLQRFTATAGRLIGAFLGSAVTGLVIGVALRESLKTANGAADAAPEQN